MIQRRDFLFILTILNNINNNINRAGAKINE